MSNYIIRLKDRLICFYYNDSSIVYKIYENNHWSKLRIAVNNCLSRFTVTLDNYINIYCTEKDQRLVRYTTHNLISWTNTTLDTIEVPSASVFPVGDSLLYNNLSSLYYKSNDDNEHKYLDDFIKIQDIDFQVQNITNDHIIVFYQSKNDELVKMRKSNIFSKEDIDESFRNIGYMEVGKTNFSNFKPIHTTNYQIYDVSFITTYDSIHALYIVKSLFSYQLVYKCKSKEEFDQPIVIWEGQRMVNCLLQIIKNELYAFFKHKNQIFVSKKNGNAFSRPEIYKNKICKEQKRAIFISNENMNEKDFFIRNIYVDAYNPWDIQILPELYEDFYYFNEPKKTSENLDVIKTSEKHQKSDLKNENTKGELFREVKDDTFNMEESLNENIENPPHWSYSFEGFNTQLNTEFNNEPFKKQDLNNKDNIINEKDMQLHYMAEIIESYKSQKHEVDLEKVKLQKEIEKNKEQEERYFEKIENLKKRINELEDSERKLLKQLEDYKPED